MNNSRQTEISKFSCPFFLVLFLNLVGSSKTVAASVLLDAYDSKKLHPSVCVGKNTNDEKMKLGFFPSFKLPISHLLLVTQFSFQGRILIIVHWQLLALKYQSENANEITLNGVGGRKVLRV